VANDPVTQSADLLDCGSEVADTPPPKAASNQPLGMLGSLPVRFPTPDRRNGGMITTTPVSGAWVRLG